jgi:AbrB family looped-hinge helix DNA binding protein
MELTLDKFGRILIPKEIREELGLRPGSSLHLEKLKDGIQLKAIEDGQSLVRKGSTLVFVGKMIGDVEGIIDQIREERGKRNWGEDE